MLEKMLNNEKKKKIGLSPKDRKIRMMLCKILCSILFIISIGLVLVGYNQVKFGIHSPKWPTVKGEIVKSEIGWALGSTAGSYRYWPKIHYSYRVHDTDYIGTRLYFIQSGAGKEWAMKKVGEYPISKTVDVFYYHSEPQISVLEPGGSFKGITETIGAIIMFCCVFLSLTFVSYWDYRRVKNACFDTNSNMYYIT